jgi:hypothetical protein
MAKNFQEPLGGRASSECPWSDHKITIDNGVSFAQQETLLSQYTTRFISKAENDPMFDFYTAPSAKDPNATVLYFVCKYCMVSNSTGSHKRGSVKGRPEPFAFERSYIQNIIKHACTGQHHRAVLNFHRGYLACMKEVAKTTSLANKDTCGTSGEGHTNTYGEEVNAYVTLHRYVRWREELLRSGLGKWAEDPITWTNPVATPSTVEVWGAVSMTTASLRKRLFDTPDNVTDPMHATHNAQAAETSTASPE